MEAPMASYALSGIRVQRLRGAMAFNRHLPIISCVLAILLTAGAGTRAAALPAVGDIYVYRVINVYNGEPRGQVSYRVEKVDQNHITVSVSSQGALVEAGRIEVRAA